MMPRTMARDDPDFQRDVGLSPKGQQPAIRHLRVLAEASRAFAEAGLDLQSVLDAITHQVAGLATDLCVIRLLSEDGDWLVPVASFHPDHEAQRLMEQVLAMPQRADEGMQGAVVTVPRESGTS